MISSHLGRFHGSFSRGWKAAIKSPKPRAGRKPGGGCWVLAASSGVGNYAAAPWKMGDFFQHLAAPGRFFLLEMLNKHHEH